MADEKDLAETIRNANNAGRAYLEEPTIADYIIERGERFCAQIKEILENCSYDPSWAEERDVVRVYPAYGNVAELEDNWNSFTGTVILEIGRSGMLCGAPGVVFCYAPTLRRLVALCETFKVRDYSEIITALEKYAYEDLRASLATVSWWGVPHAHNRRENINAIGDTHLDSSGCFRADTITTDASGITFDVNTRLWAMREHARTLIGRYHPLPDKVLAALPEAAMALYPHLALKPGNAGMIAYTRSASDGVHDRQAVIKAGRFIRQFCPDLSDEQVKQLTAEVTAAFSADIHHTKDRKEIAHVYMNGPSSCMSYGPDGKRFGRLFIDGAFVHPTEVYAHPDNAIELVYLKVGERIAARALVNSRKKQYASIYNSDSVAGAYDRLRDYLVEVLDYEQNDYALEGEKLLRLSPDKHPRAIICPYIDCGNVGVSIHDDFLIVDSDAGYCANHETGCLESYDTSEPDWVCVCCDQGYSDYDTAYYDQDGGSICEDCIGNYTEAYQPGTFGPGTVYVEDGHYRLYRDRSHYHGSEWLYLPIGPEYHNFRELDGDHYDDNDVGHEYRVVELVDGGWVLSEDVGSGTLSDYFIHQDEDMAHRIEEYAVLVEDGESRLVERSELPDESDLVGGIVETAAGSTYPQLPHYRVNEQEEAA